MFNYFDFTAHTKRLFCLCKTFIGGAVICKLRHNLFSLRYSGLLLYKEQQQQLFHNLSNTSYPYIHIILVQRIIQDQLYSVNQFTLDSTETRNAFEEYRSKSYAMTCNLT